MPDASTIERIEVLRGPAAMLYGRSDPGGTFNIVSKQPQAERRTVLGSQVNSEGLRRGTLDTTGALDEQAAFTYRLNLVAEGGDSFRDDVESEIERDIGNLFGWIARARLRVRVRPRGRQLGEERR